ARDAERIAARLERYARGAEIGKRFVEPVRRDARVAAADEREPALRRRTVRQQRERRLEIAAAVGESAAADSRRAARVQYLRAEIGIGRRGGEIEHLVERALGVIERAGANVDLREAIVELA